MVTLVRDERSADDTRRFALKTYAEQAALQGRREAALLGHLCRLHAPFVRLLGAHRSPAGRLCLRLELMRCSLFDLYPHDQRTLPPRPRLRPLPMARGAPLDSAHRPALNLDALRRVALALCSALLLLQREGLLHADVKPEVSSFK